MHFHCTHRVMCFVFMANSLTTPVAHTMALRGNSQNLVSFSSINANETILYFERKVSSTLRISSERLLLFLKRELVFIRFVVFCCLNNRGRREIRTLSISLFVLTIKFAKLFSIFCKRQLEKLTYSYNFRIH